MTEAGFAANVAKLVDPEGSGARPIEVPVDHMDYAYVEKVRAGARGEGSRGARAAWQCRCVIGALPLRAGASCARTQCSDPRELRAILDRLQSGDEGRYAELEAFTEARMVECMPPAERHRFLVLKSEATPGEVAAARADVAGWVAKIKAVDASLAGAGDAAPGGGRRGEEREDVFETAAPSEPSAPGAQRGARAGCVRVPMSARICGSYDVAAAA